MLLRIFGSVPSLLVYSGMSPMDHLMARSLVGPAAGLASTVRTPEHRLLDVVPRVGLPRGGLCAWPALLTVGGVPKFHGTTCLPSASLA